MYADGSNGSGVVGATQPSSVYRMYDKGGVLIYVGLTDRGHLRQADHLASKAWAREIAETHWEHFDTREEAAHRERDLIEEKHPQHNVVYRSPDAEPDRIEFRYRAEQLDLLVELERETKVLRAEINRFYKSFDARFHLLEKIGRIVFSAMHSECDPNSQAVREQINAARRYLSHLEMLRVHDTHRRGGFCDE